ncbi:hypothetical protein DYI24_13250 [Rhodopseudomonas sp. BR0C11]|uniref:hypothetical protein n=1 Tax=Rhodopseudomonas sp. BR0C11 TaxID=2269370 RepID=UPI0013E07423|nr:hypothetical protein [Rhodopseudomonas sp. BR0C11]NEV78004.1 hypothetical protein [Rhodopseudomonas sp. BR0C11]
MTIDDGHLDISMHGWPALENPEDVLTLFTNMKAAFSQARKLRISHMPSHYQQIGIRHIASMSPQQLACIKHFFWSDRLGSFQDMEKDWQGLFTLGADRMLRMLNCDGRAQLFARNNCSEKFVPEFPTVADKIRMDLDPLWFDHLDYVNKWKDSDKFEGVIARWSVDHFAEEGR